MTCFLEAALITLTIYTHLQFDQASGLCSLTCAGAKQVLSSLLAELLFTKGAAALGNVPHLYQAYFETPLHLCGASSFVGLIKESPFSIMFEVSWRRGWGLCIS